MNYSGFDTPEGVPGRKPWPDALSHSENEMRLLDYLDGKLNQAGAEEVENHLRTCERCREFRDQWEQLDLELVRMETPRLSPGFQQRLRLQISEIPLHPRRTGQTQSAEADSREHWERIRRNFLRAQAIRLLDYAGFTAAAALGGYLLYAVSLRALAGSPNWAGSVQQWVLPISAGTGLVILLGSLALVARKHITDWIGTLCRVCRHVLLV